MYKTRWFEHIISCQKDSLFTDNTFVAMPTEVWKQCR